MAESEPAPSEAQLFLKIGNAFVPVPWDIYPSALREATRDIERMVETDRRFWHDAIQEESERLRFNQGYEPISVDLYPWSEKDGPAFLGRTQIGHVKFHAVASWVRDKSGRKTLRVQIHKGP
jgi:hypothetical protein